MTPFLSTFWAITVCDIHFCISKWTKFFFVYSHLWSTLVCKMSEFRTKATDSDKPPYYSKKKKTLRRLIVHIVFCHSRGAKKNTIRSCTNSYKNKHMVATYYFHFIVSLSQTGTHGNTDISNSCL